MSVEDEIKLDRQYRLSLYTGENSDLLSLRLVELVSPRFLSCEGKKGKKLSAILEDDPSNLQYDVENKKVLLHQLERMEDRKEVIPLPIHLLTYQNITSFVAGYLLGAIYYLNTYGMDTKIKDIPHRFVHVEKTSDDQPISVKVMASQVRDLKEPSALFLASSLAVEQFSELSREYCGIHYTVKDFLNDNPSFLPRGMKHCPF